jgi:nucleotide-binding universal stress UspA family protein
MVRGPSLGLIMRALVWLVEDTWQTTIAQATALLPAAAEITLLHVAEGEAEEMVRGTQAGLLGRPGPPHERRMHGRHPPDGPRDRVRAISEQAAQALLADAERTLGRPARLVSRRGRVEREVLAQAAGHDLLLMARDGDRAHPGPRSLGPHARFVLDHAPCQVLLVWPDAGGGATAP